jgi:Protein of unknown function (DUF551)
MTEKLPTIADYEDIHQCKSEWINVKERLPEKRGYYLVFSKSWKIEFKVLQFDKHSDKSPRMRFWWSGNECHSITHWQPLPEPPNNKE